MTKPVYSLSISARAVLNLHSLNNEGTEGNQQQTRMVHIIDQRGRQARPALSAALRHVSKPARKRQ